MKPVDQQILTHDPENGIFGDCQRACIASLLELELEQVPHFFTTPTIEYQDGFEFNSRVNRFLLPYGLFHIEFSYCGFKDLLDFQSELSGIYHMIYGRSPRSRMHAVVALDGEMVHDPHPSRTGLIDSKDKWRVGILCSTCSNPLNLQPN